MVKNNKEGMYSRLLLMINLMNHNQQWNFYRDLLKALEGEDLSFVDQSQPIKMQNLSILQHFKNNEKLAPLTVGIHELKLSSDMNCLVADNFIPPVQVQKRHDLYELNRRRHHSGNAKYDACPADNPVIAAATEFFAKFEQQCQFPARECANCKELELGMTLNQENLCDQCRNDKIRAKLGPENNMHPYPDGFPVEALGDLTQVEKMAISLVLPVMRIFLIQFTPLIYPS